MDSSTVNIWGLNVDHNIVFSVAASLIASLFVGVTLLLIQSFTKWNSKRIKLNKYREYFEILIRNLETSILAVSNNLRKLNKEWKKYKLTDNILEWSVELKLKQLKNINVYDLLEIYLIKKFTNIGAEGFYLLLRNLEKVEVLSDNVAEDYKYTVKNFSDFESQYNEHFLKLRNFYDVIINNSTNLSQDKFLLEVHTYYTKLRTVDRKELLNVKSEIILPLISICEKYKINDERSLNMLYILQEILMDIKNRINTADFGMEQMYKHDLGLIKNYKEIKKVLFRSVHHSKE